MKWINFVDGLQSTIILSGFEIIFDISMELDGWRLTMSQRKLIEISKKWVNLARRNKND